MNFMNLFLFSDPCSFKLSSVPLLSFATILFALKRLSAMPLSEMIQCVKRFNAMKPLQ